MKAPISMGVPVELGEQHKATGEKIAHPRKEKPEN